MYISEDKRQRRWLITINNPIFKDSGLVEEDITNTDLEVIENRYDNKVVSKEENIDLFEFKYIKQYFEEEKVYKIVKRPFFKNLSCIETYVRNLDLKYIIYQYERGLQGTPHIYHLNSYIKMSKYQSPKSIKPL